MSEITVDVHEELATANVGGLHWLLVEHGLALFVTSDNLREGAAFNAVGFPAR